MNRISITGRFTDDPEIKEVKAKKDGKTVKVCNFSVAVNDRAKDRTDFIECSVWSKTAEYVASHLSKGSLVSVDGKLRQDKYEDKDGKMRYTYFIEVSEIENLAPKKAETEGTPAKAESSSKLNSGFMDAEEEPDFEEASRASIGNTPFD